MMLKSKPPTANQMTADLLIKIARRFPDSMAWRNNTGRGIGWSQIKSAIGCLHRRDIDGALKFLVRPMSFGLIGSADLLVVLARNGRLLGIEVKAEGDGQRIEQIAWQRRLESLGGGYIIAVDVDGTLAELDLYASGVK